MAKRPTYPTTMETAFQRLTVDGVTLSGLDAERTFAKAMSKGGRSGQEWRRELHSTIFHLTLMASGLPAATSGTTGPPKH